MGQLQETQKRIESLKKTIYELEQCKVILSNSQQKSREDLFKYSETYSRNRNEELNAQIVSLEKRIEDISQIIKSTKTELDMLEECLPIILRGSMKTDFESFEQDCIEKTLLKNSKTISIMSQFSASSKQFLALNGIIRQNLFPSKGLQCELDLVISKQSYGYNPEKSFPTMSEIKSIIGSDTTLDMECCPKRVRPLIRECMAIIKKENTPRKELFRRPYLIGGQTYDNRDGYGSYYEAKEYRRRQARNYVKITSFYAIGARIRKL